MNIAPVRPQTIADRHVHFSEVVEVRYIPPRQTTEIQPTLSAKRLEQELKNKPNVIAQEQAPPPAQSKPVQVYKNYMHNASIVCGALIIPSFACLALGPIGLVAPGVLLSLSLTCALLGGRPTEAMQQARAELSVEMAEYDPR